MKGMIRTFINKVNGIDFYNLLEGSFVFIYALNSTLVWIGFIFGLQDNTFFFINCMLAGIIGFMWMGTLLFPLLVCMFIWEELSEWAKKEVIKL